MLLNLKFSEDDIISENLLKNSTTRNLFLRIQDIIPNLPKTSLVLDKKISVIKWYQCLVMCLSYFSRNKLEIYKNQTRLIFLNSDNTLYIPFLQIVHKCKNDKNELISIDPCLLPEIFLDLGALLPILKGADIMCPGLLKKDFYLCNDLKEGDLVVRLVYFSSLGNKNRGDVSCYGNWKNDIINGTNVIFHFLLFIVCYIVALQEKVRR